MLNRLTEAGTKPEGMAENDFTVRFWGVRGSIACGGPDYDRYGGNTSCVEMRCGPHRLIFDGGTGLRLLGQELVKHPDEPIHLFLSHTHFDHVCGLPFFAPFYAPRCNIHLYAGNLNPEHSLESVLHMMMQSPLFPIPPTIFSACLEKHDFYAGETLAIAEGLRIKTAPLNHPDGATAYRIEWGGRAACYVTDTEHRPAAPDENILRLIEGADLFIYDGMFCDKTFEPYRGWGHSTWQEGARLAKAAGVKRYAIFHHNPDHDDQMMDAIAEEAEKFLAGSFVAQEGLTIRL